MFTLAFFSGLTERAIKTFAQSLLAVIGVTGLGFGDVDWPLALSAAGLAALASVLTSVVAPGFTAGATEPQGRHEAADGYPIPEPHEATVSPDRTTNSKEG